MLDVLVIGAGLSGLMAAYTAARNGRQVKVVTKGLGGALHWSAGTIDVLGYVPGESDEAHTPLHEFVVKLQHIKDRMYTNSGRKMALVRHQYMVAFFEQMRDEVNGKQ